MNDVFVIVLFIVVGVSTICSIAALITTRRLQDQIGNDPFYHPKDLRGLQEDPVVVSDDVRQMLAARNALREARGEPTVDVDAELERVLMQQETSQSPDNPDEDLVAEIRAHVEASNARRIQRGEKPIDIEQEIAKKLRGE